MIITDPHMLRKMDRALKEGNQLFDLNSILENLRDGSMQGHIEGDTWAITQVHDFPCKRTVNIVFVVGHIEESLKLEAKVEAWAKEMGADLLTAVGREGWWEHRTPGWKKTGVLYSKELQS